MARTLIVIEELTDWLIVSVRNNSEKFVKAKTLIVNEEVNFVLSRLHCHGVMAVFENKKNVNFCQVNLLCFCVEMGEKIHKKLRKKS